MSTTNLKMKFLQVLMDIPKRSHSSFIVSYSSTISCWYPDSFPLKHSHIFQQEDIQFPRCFTVSQNYSQSFSGRLILSSRGLQTLVAIGLIFFMELYSLPWNFLPGKEFLHSLVSLMKPGCTTNSLSDLKLELKLGTHDDVLIHGGGVVEVKKFLRVKTADGGGLSSKLEGDLAKEERRGRSPASRGSVRRLRSSGSSS